jgi:hypothetical protein
MLPKDGAGMLPKDGAVLLFVSHRERERNELSFFQSHRTDKNDCGLQTIFGGM